MKKIQISGFSIQVKEQYLNALLLSINKHVKNIYDDCELEQLATIRKFRIVQITLNMDIMILGVQVVKKKPEEIERVIASVRASMAVEGMKPSAKARAIGRQYLEGKISSKEAITRIKTLHAAKFGK